MHQLMYQYPPPLTRLWLILSLSKHHISSHRICQRIHSLCRLRCLPIGMYSHLTKIMSKARLHKCPCSSIQGLSWRTQSLMHNSRHAIHQCSTHSNTLYHPFTFLAALFTLSTGDGVLTAGAFALQGTSLHWSE